MTVRTTAWTPTDAWTALQATQADDPRTIRWDIATVLVLASEAHFGGREDLTGSSGAVDQLIHRDDAGRPSTAFSSLTGALSHHLQDCQYGYRFAGPPAALFGSTQRKGCLEGPALVWQPPGSAHLPATLVRSHNRVTPAAGTVADGALWSTEVLPIGSSALLVMHLFLTPGEEADRLAELLAACTGLHSGVDGIRWGARKRPGAGSVDARGWAARRHDLSTLDGLLPAITSGHADLAAGLRHKLDTNPAPTLQAALDTALGSAGNPLASPLPVDERRWATLRVTLHVGVTASDGTTVPGLLLIADTPPPGWETIDLVQRTIPRPAPNDPTRTDWTLALGGEPAHSWFKRAAHLAAHAIAATTPAVPQHQAPIATVRANQMVETWFGTLDPEAGSPRPGRIVLDHDTTVRGATLIRRGRVPLDPVFGGGIDGLLFDEAPAGGGHIDLTIAVRDPDPAILGLLTQVVWDGAETGLVTIGGHGHGLVTITAATLEENTPTGTGEIDLLTDPPHGRVTTWVTAARTAITTGPGDATPGPTQGDNDA